MKTEIRGLNFAAIFRMNIFLYTTIVLIFVVEGGVNEAVSSVCEKTGAVHEVINIGEPPINDQQVIMTVIHARGRHYSLH